MSEILFLLPDIQKSSKPIAHAPQPIQYAFLLRETHTQQSILQIMREFFISDLEGYTPQIGRLVHMMDYARFTTLEAIQDMNMEELDLLPEGHKNTVGMLLEHMVAVEKCYQLFTFGNYENEEDIMEDLDKRWHPGVFLGDLGREHIKGHPLSYYLSHLEETRQETLAEFAKRDDQWLEESLPFWESTGNRYFMWFHVFEDEINHRGQIRLLKHHMPRLIKKTEQQQNKS